MSERGLKEPITSEVLATAQTIQSPEDAKALEQKIQEAGVLLQLKRLDWKKKKAWHRGKSAKEIGFARVSPYYEDDGAEAAWLAGYDGKDEPTLDAILVPVLDAPAA